MKDDDRFRYRVGEKVMGVLHNTPIAGEILERSVFDNSMMCTINNIDDPDNLAMKIIVEEKRVIPYDDIDWKEAVEFWDEGNILIKGGEASKRLALRLVSNNLTRGDIKITSNK